MLTPRPDLAGGGVVPDMAQAVDFAGVDLAGVDLSVVVQPDMAQPPADLSSTDI
jgi:hypothetical protein